MCANRHLDRAGPASNSPMAMAAGVVGALTVLLPGSLFGQEIAATAPNELPSYRLAASQLTELDARDGLTSRVEMLRRNLSRYFVVYAVPETTDELQRVLGTAERMAWQAARLFYRSARSLAEAEGATTVRLAHVRAVTDRLLPNRANEWNEVVFFPAAEPTPVEIWDLDAFRDTGLAWQALGWLAETQIATAQPVMPLEEDAARALTDAVNAYALLVFRLGGQHAAAEQAPHLRTDHLRAAGKTVAERARGEAARIGPAPPEERSGRFFDAAAESVGLDYRHVTSDWLGRYRRYGPIAPSFSGGGAAAADVDGDLWDDVVICGGRGCELFFNRRGRFELAEASPISTSGEARMPILADLDNDGDKDLFVTYARDTNRLLINDGAGHFTDVTDGSGLEREGDISGPAVAFDADGDGLLDLYVGNFGNYLAGASAWVAPDAKNAQGNRLYINRGAAGRGLHFEETTAAAAVADDGWAQAISHCDCDGDGDQDLYVANDFGRNQLYLNRGDGTFVPSGDVTGSDDPHHGMNVAFADLNRDRLPDIFVTNIWFWASAKRTVTETNTLLLSTRAPQGGVTYQRSTDQGLVGPDSSWSWGGAFFDLENDGDEDLYVANGFTDYMTFVQYRPRPEQADQLYPIHNARDPNLLFTTRDSEIPNHLESDTGAALTGLNSRAVVPLDYDRDGDLDLLVTTFHSRARLLRNHGASGNWLALTLEGDPAAGSNRDAIGATVIATGNDGFYAWRAVTGGEGYLAMETPAVELGLGARSSVSLEITWPSGVRQTLSEVGANQFLRLREGEAEPTIATTENGAPP